MCQQQRVRTCIRKDLTTQIDTFMQCGASSALRAWLVALCQRPRHSRLYRRRITRPWRLNKGALKRQPCALGVNRLCILARRLGNHIVE